MVLGEPPIDFSEIVEFSISMNGERGLLEIFHMIIVFNKLVETHLIKG